MVTIGAVLDVLEQAYPVRLAEPWDSGIGLTCGDRTEPVDTVLLAVDVDPATVDEAITLGAQLLVTHHPLLFRPVQSVAADRPRGGLVHRMIRAGVAHFAAHTNADRADGGVNDALAAALGLTDITPLEPVPDGPSAAEGLGRIGVLPSPIGLTDFARLVAATLPETVGGVRAGGDRDRLVRRVAVCGGSGGSLIDAATKAGADVFVTSDLGHHPAGEHLASGRGPALVEVAHFAGEWPWLAFAAARIEQAFPGQVAARVSTVRTDPWSVRV